MHSLSLGNTSITVPAVGVGTWQWGDGAYWNYGQTHNRNDCNEAFEVSLDEGLTLFDTAEVYGFGESERILGGLARSTDRKVVIASKFFPLPWRVSYPQFRRALRRSLRRLGASHIDLYQVHWPARTVSIPRLMDWMAEAHSEGLIRAVGVSNFNVAQMELAASALAKHSLPLASNQVPYHLLDRSYVTNGVLAACRAMNVTLIAYSPLAQGLLTGKYHNGDRTVTGLRSRRGSFSAANIARTAPLIDKLVDIASRHQRTPAQVAINWLAVQPGVLPIPGAKNARQAADNARSIGWAITEDDADELDRLSKQVAPA